ncbi:hypothetical protein NHX12_007884 [Muraenolepis orangiensis]|uniref:Uncharacterized protein n=1 Tax=Muraenolepis orangiensis TaxID=630683 RepID=A0A9Q0DUC6_9TELE|nr:hypothetical protein NHX12_007884 [Muraenolepis orangiensis]
MRLVCSLLLALCLLGSGSCGPQAGGSPPQARLGRLERWVRSAVQYLKLQRCRRVVSFLAEGDCRRSAQLQLFTAAVYASEPVTHLGAPDKVVALLPDSVDGPRPLAAHDAVLLVDPSPGESFGHPVLLFYVDLNVTKKRCSLMDGLYLGDECLTLALKGRCQNQLKRRPSASQRLLGDLERRVGPCEVTFLPLVVGLRDSNKTQRLRCIEHPEFGPCPRPLAAPPPSQLQSSCELNRGWQQQILYQHQLQSLQRFYQMLRTNGFHQDRIKTFFSGPGHTPEGVEGVLPAVEKAVIRQYVSYVCRKHHCVDSLVLFLNSPTRTDGSMLLWDHNLNGIAELKERYSVNELLVDLAGCRASRVLVFVDQSYSSVLFKRLRSSSKHHNNLPHRPPGKGKSRLLSPWAGLLNVTLGGAPCKATPPLTDGELRREYLGCQNLPSARWFQNQQT